MTSLHNTRWFGRPDRLVVVNTAQVQTNNEKMSVRQKYLLYAAEETSRYALICSMKKEHSVK